MSAPNFSNFNYSGTFEVQDPEYGNMTTSVDMFLSFNGGSEVLYQTFNKSHEAHHLCSV